MLARPGSASGGPGPCGLASIGEHHLQPEGILSCCDFQENKTFSFIMVHFNVLFSILILIFSYPLWVNTLLSGREIKNKI